MRQIGGSWVMIVKTNTQAEITSVYIYKYRFFLIFGYKPKQPHARLLLIFQNKYLSLIFSLLLFAGGWILATSHCVLAWAYTWDSLLVKNVKRLWPIHTVQISNMQYAFGVQVYEEVFNLEFYSVFSEQFIKDEILLCKRL